MYWLVDNKFEEKIQDAKTLFVFYVVVPILGGKLWKMLELNEKCAGTLEAKPWMPISKANSVGILSEKGQFQDDQNLQLGLIPVFFMDLAHN